jgi:hypothetical protein
MAETVRSLGWPEVWRRRLARHWLLAPAGREHLADVVELHQEIVRRVGDWAGEGVWPAFGGAWPRWSLALGHAAQSGVLCFGRPLIDSMRGALEEVDAEGWRAWLPPSHPPRAESLSEGPSVLLLPQFDCYVVSCHWDLWKRDGTSNPAMPRAKSLHCPSATLVTELRALVFEELI